MTGTMTDLFDEQRIQIAGNPLLEGLCNHILQLVEKDPELLTGDQVGVINRKLTLALWKDEGLMGVLDSDNMERFEVWFRNIKSSPGVEAIERAVRYLSSNDYIRLPKKAIENAEMHRQRISRSISTK